MQFFRTICNIAILSTLLSVSILAYSNEEILLQSNIEYSTNQTIEKTLSIPLFCILETQSNIFVSQLPNTSLSSNYQYNNFWCNANFDIRIDNQYSQYVRYHENIRIEYRKSDLLFPFQYFW